VKGNVAWLRLHVGPHEVNDALMLYQRDHKDSNCGPAHNQRDGPRQVETTNQPHPFEDDC